MKNFFTRLLFISGFVVYLFLLGNRSGAIAGVTGAPGEETCGRIGCHNTTPNQGNATINLAFGNGATNYTPGETHKINISIDSPQNAGRNGFEIVALDDQNTNAGEWNLSGNDKQSRSGNNREYITHTNTGSAQSSWEIDWKAPEADAGNITFYLAFNDANGNGSSSGDNIYTASLTVSALSTSIETIAGLESANAYPNPFQEILGLNLKLTQDKKLSGSLINPMGQFVKTLFDEKISAGESTLQLAVPNNLSSGLYFLEIKSATGGFTNIPVIKQ